MRSTLLSLVLLSVLLSSGSQVLLKRGMISAPVRAALANHEQLKTVLAIATAPSILVGLICFGLSAIVWLFVLARIPLSSAYPFVALGIVVTVVAGWLLFSEALSLAKLIGVA